MRRWGEKAVARAWHRRRLGPLWRHDSVLISSVPDLARAEAWAQKFERSHRALTAHRSLCEIEKRKPWLTDENGSDVTYSHQNVSANPTNVTQTESVTLSPTEANDVIGTIQAAIESSISKQEEKTALLEALQSLQRAKDRPSFLKRITLFLGLATNVPILASHINTWALVLGNLGEHF